MNPKTPAPDTAPGSPPDAGPQTVAAVDLGSNSFHLIVARIEHGQFQVIDRIKEMVQLGAGLGEDKRLTPAAESRALACLERFGQRLRALPRGSALVGGSL